MGQPDTSVYSAILPSCTRCAGKTESDIAPVRAKVSHQSVRCYSVELILEVTCLCETAHGHAGMKRVVVFAEKIPLCTQGAYVAQEFVLLNIFVHSSCTMF